MANYLTNNEKFHIFSKSPVLSSMAVSQAVNKSGHTVSTNDVWADDVPWFTEVADEAGAITRAADARYNDLILWGSDIYVRKGDKTNGASTGTTFAELWEKHTELTEARAYALGSVTTQTPTNIVTKTVEIKNASDKVVLKYHVGKQIDLLTTANNANVASTWAARMFIDGKVVDQFVSPTDKVFAGNPSTGYTTLVYTATTASNKYGFVAEGEADGDFVNNAFAGIVQFNQSRTSTHKFAASVFEYVGDKLDATVAKLSAAVFGSGTPGGEDQPADLVTQVNINTGDIATLKGDVNTDGSIAQKINEATKSLAAKTDIKISEIKVKVGSGDATPLIPDSNKSVTVEIPEVQAAAVSGGVITTDGFAKASDAKAIAEKAIESAIADGSTIDTRIDEVITTAVADGGTIDNRIDTLISDATSTTAIVDNDTSTKLVTAKQVSEYVASEVGAIDTGVTTISVNGGEAKKGAVSITALEGIADSLHTDISPSSIRIDEENNSVKLTVHSAGAQVSGDTLTYSRYSNYLATADDADVIATFRASEAKTALADTAITGDNLSVAGAGVSVTLGGTVGAPTLTGSVTPATYTSSTKSWTNDSNFAKASDIATAISDAVGAITIPSVTTSTAAQTVGVTASGHEVSVATAEYAAATDAWTNKGYLVTGSTVEAYVTDVVSEVSSDLTALENKVNAYHKAGVSYKIHTEPTLPDLSIEDNVKEYKNVILLVSKELNNPMPPSAVSGDYTEYLCVNKGTEEAPQWVWEQIGTTKADLNSYVKAITVNGKQKYTDTDVPNYLTLGSFAETVASGQATTLANQGSVYANIATNGTLTLGVASATDSVMGVSKMFTGNLTTDASTVTDTAVSVKSAQAMYSTLATEVGKAVKTINGYSPLNGNIKICAHNGVSDDFVDGTAIGEGTTTHMNLWGMSIGNSFSGDGTINILDTFVGIPAYNSGTGDSYLNLAALPSNAVTVENNFVMNADGKVITTIRPERMYSGFNATTAKGLKSFVGDLSNLENSSWGDSHNTYTFYECTALETFIGDLSSLTDGQWMFYACSLKSFISDLSSLTNGENMFKGCKLNAESLECIADTLPTVTSGSLGEIGYNCSAAEAQAAQTAIQAKGWTCTMYHSY